MSLPSFDRRLLRPIVLTRPVRLVEPSSWVTHVPFAFWLVDAMRPRIVVELGTHSGNSYAALAQAVQAAGLDATCYAVDSWAGDAQAGFYGEEVFREWSAFHDLHFAAFSRLVRATFDEALTHFADASIDLLHLDGLHTYEAVRHDFESWCPKLSPRAVVLFHDVNVREADFGVWRYWEELRQRFPSFTFRHGHGLGVLAVGRDVAADVSWLAQLPAGGEDASLVSRFFSALGDALRLQVEVSAGLAAASEADRRIRDLEASLSAVQQTVSTGGASVDPNLADLAQQLEEMTAAKEEAAAQRAAVWAQLLSAEAARDEAARRLTEAETERAATSRDLSNLQDEVDRQAERARRAERTSSARERHVRAVQATLQHTRGALEVFEQQVRFTAASRIQDTAPVSSSRLGRARARLRDAHVPLDWSWRRPLRFARSVARLRRREYRALVAQLSDSGLFDVAHYREVSGIGPQVNPVSRFLLAGDAAGESPHPLFDPMWYRQQNPDLETVPPLQHYLRAGGWELRSPHPLFDARYYLGQWPPHSVNMMTPLSHYIRVGGFVGASPHPLFDGRHVVEQRPDIVIAGVNPLAHYLRVATVEMLDPHPLFSTRFYCQTHSDLSEHNPLAHFVREGAAEGRSPHPLVDIGFYWEQRPDVRAAGANALEHYLHAGWREGVNPHPLFDTNFYLEQALGLGETGINPLVHYLRWGWRDGLRPNRWFDPQYYEARYPDTRGVNPLLHFVQDGWREHRDPSPEFSVRGYLSANRDIAAVEMDPLSHFLRYGRAEGRDCGRGVIRPAGTENPIVLRVSGEKAAARTLLCVSHVSPWPVRAGNEYRLARLLRHFKVRGFRIVLVLAPINSEPLAPGALDQAAAEFGNVVLCHRDGRVEQRLRDVPDVLSRLSDLPLAVDEEESEATLGPPDRGFCHDTVYAVAVALSQAISPAVVLVEYIFMTRILAQVEPKSLRMVDTIDVFSQKESNVMAYGISDAGVSPEVESQMVGRADVVIAIHPADAAALEEMTHGREVIVTGVDADVRTERRWPSEFVALLPGSGNPLNQAGLRDFLRFAWPRIKTLVPEATLRVAGGVGRVVPPGTAGVTVLGHVPDLAAEYEAARVVINPAVAGTGLKIKTVEALAHLTPVVGWAHNRDGLSERLSAYVDEVRDWQEFADAVAKRLLASQSPIDADGIRAITGELAADAIYRALDERVDRFFAGRASS